MTEIRQCWAYKWGTGDRCDMPGGHPGNHSTSTTWSDLDCHTPCMPPLATEGLELKGKPGLPVTHIAVEPPAPVKCVTCNHHHRGGVCKCGCYEHIG